MKTKAVNIQLVDEFIVGQNVYDNFLNYLRDVVKSGDLSAFDFHIIDDSSDLPVDGMLR